MMIQMYVATTYIISIRGLSQIAAEISVMLQVADPGHADPFTDLPPVHLEQIVISVEGGDVSCVFLNWLPLL